MPSTPPQLLWIAGDRLLAEERWRALVGKGDLVRIDGRKLDVGALSGEIDTMPMFVDHKWILVQDFRLPDKRAAASEDGSSADPESYKRLLAALSRVGPTCTVILVSDSGDKKTKLYKLVQERGEYVELASFKDYETGKMAEWVAGRLQERGKRIAPPLALEFVECVGPDVGLLASEVDKLTLAMGDDPVVADSHMEVVAGSPVALRRLIDEGIARKQPARAQKLLDQTLASNEAPLRILNFIIPRVRDLLKARLLPEGRNDSQKAAAVFGNMHPFRLKVMYEESSRFTAAELRGAMHSLTLADTCLKSSVEPAHVLSLLVAALTGSISHAAFARAMESYVEPWD